MIITIDTGATMESKTFSVRTNAENLAALDALIAELDTDRNSFVLECIAKCVPDFDLQKEQAHLTK